MRQRGQCKQRQDQTVRPRSAGYSRAAARPPQAAKRPPRAAAEQRDEPAASDESCHLILSSRKGCSSTIAQSYRRALGKKDPEATAGHPTLTSLCPPGHVMRLKERVACALLEHGTLTGAEIEKLVWIWGWP